MPTLLPYTDRVEPRGGGEASSPGEADALPMADHSPHSRTHSGTVPRTL
jgi:hypothetical protein